MGLSFLHWFLSVNHCHFFNQNVAWIECRLKTSIYESVFWCSYVLAAVLGPPSLSRNVANKHCSCLMAVSVSVFPWWHRHIQSLQYMFIALINIIRCWASALVSHLHCLYTYFVRNSSLLHLVCWLLFYHSINLNSSANSPDLISTTSMTNFKRLSRI